MFKKRKKKIGKLLIICTWKDYLRFYKGKSLFRFWHCVHTPSNILAPKYEHARCHVSNAQQRTCCRNTWDVYPYPCPRWLPRVGCTWFEGAATVGAFVGAGLSWGVAECHGCHACQDPAGGCQGCSSRMLRVSLRLCPQLSRRHPLCCGSWAAWRHLQISYCYSLLFTGSSAHPTQKS